MLKFGTKRLKFSQMEIKIPVLIKRSGLEFVVRCEPQIGLTSQSVAAVKSLAMY